jgi:predicted negative regulator of RcsB-dependent stress response
VAAVFSGIMYSFQKAENTAALLVSQALNKYAKANDPDKGYSETQSDFQAVFTEYANTTAGKHAKLKFAKICYDAAKFDQSYTLYKESLEIFKKDALMANLIQASLGHVCLARGEFEQAEKYFLQIEEGKTDLLRDQAGYALAMLYETQNDPDLGKKMYERIVTEHANSMYLPIAKSKIDEMQ